MPVKSTTNASPPSRGGMPMSTSVPKGTAAKGQPSGTSTKGQDSYVGRLQSRGGGGRNIKGMLK